MGQYWLRQSASSLSEGPLSATELKRRAAAAEITEDALISADGNRWTQASNVRGLFPKRPKLVRQHAVPLEDADSGTPVTPSPACKQMRTCPYCAEEILDAAIKCRYCGERLDAPFVQPTARKEICTTCRGGFLRHMPYNFYDRFQICKPCRTSLVNRRAGAYIVDVLFLYLLFFLAALAIGFVAAAGGASERDVSDVDNVISWFAYIFLVAYMLFKDGLFSGRSPGKLICGIRVVNVETQTPGGFGASALRNLPLVIPLVPLIVAIQIHGSDLSRWGDGWARTAVVRDSWLPMRQE